MRLPKTWMLIGVVIVGLGWWTIFGVKESFPQIGEKKIQIYTSIYPLHFFVSQIVDGQADVTNITPDGVEPHDYEPTAQEMADIENGDLLIINGGLEPWTEQITNTLKSGNASVVVAAQSLMDLTFEEDGHIQSDPHVWLDPVKAKQVVEAIVEGLKKVDSAQSEEYQKRADMLSTRLDELDGAYKKGLNNCANKEFVTSHSAFGYLAARYGLVQVPISGLSPEEEPSAKQLVEVTKFVNDNNIKFIFFETLVSPKLSQTVANEVGAQTLVLDPIEGVGDDDARSGKNYFTIMQGNLKNLQTALECKT